MSPPRPNPVQDLAAAFMLLTRIPVPWHFLSDTPPDHNASVWAFPIVGATVGGGGAMTYMLSLAIGLPAPVSATLAIICMVLLTGVFHEDGLADVADGFGGGQTVERKLDIMRDSRIGAYGTTALVLALALRIGGLSALTATQGAMALLVGGMLSRLMIIFMMVSMPPARQDGIAHNTGKPAFAPIAVGAALTGSVVFVLLEPRIALLCVTAAIIASLTMGWIAKQQVGGFTGDVLGATQQLSDVSVLLLLVVCWSS